jgi:hypothetical protein
MRKASRTVWRRRLAAAGLLAALSLPVSTLTGSRPARADGTLSTMCGAAGIRVANLERTVPQTCSKILCALDCKGVIDPLLLYR